MCSDVGKSFRYIIKKKKKVPEQHLHSHKQTQIYKIPYFYLQIYMHLKAQKQIWKNMHGTEKNGSSKRGYERRSRGIFLP